MPQDELLEQQIYGAVEGEFSVTRVTWLRYAALAFGIIVPIASVVLIPIHLLAVAFVAYMNCGLYTVFAIRFLKRGALGCLIPVIAPLWMVLGSCIGVIYFAAFFPNEAYETESGPVSIFASGIRYQLVIFCFLLVYFSTMTWLLRKDNALSQHPAMATKYVGYMSMAIILPVLSVVGVSMVIDLPLFLARWSNRLFVYYQTLLFAAGVVIVRISKIVKIFLVGFLVIVSFVYMLKDARGMALVPIAALFAGLFFFSELKTRTKVTLLVIMIFCVPFYMLLGSTIRTLLGSGGARVYGLTTRVSALKDWKIALTGKPIFGNIFGRLFFTGGNVVIAYTPSTYPYKHFSPGKYAKEFAIYMLPEPIIRRLIPLGEEKLYTVLMTEYTSPYLLRDYGIYISEYSSVEFSIIAHFWMLGGYVYVLVGGFVVALVHSAVAWIVRRAWAKNPDKGIFYFAVLFYPILWSTNWDFIQLTRTTFLTFIFAFVGYRFIMPILKVGYAASSLNSEGPMSEEM